MTYDNLTKYSGPIILILCACGGNNQKITKILSKEYKDDKVSNLPNYVFVFSNEAVDWSNAIVTWTIFYSKVSSLSFNEKKKYNAY